MLAILPVVLVLVVLPCEAFPVSVCGETVPANTTAVLANDLTRSGPVAVSLVCERSRDLRGGVPPGTTWGVCSLD
jgi:hypothetical protein